MRCSGRAEKHRAPVLVPVALALAAFVWLLNLHPTAAGRVYAAYGGVYVAVAIAWLWLVDGIRVTAWDTVGSLVAVAGMAIIMFAPRGRMPRHCPGVVALHERQPMTGMLQDKRILVTQAGEFMGPTLCEVLAAHGADVVASGVPLASPGEAERVVAEAGELDILVANLALPAPTTRAVEVTDAEWRETFAALVDPLPRLVRAVAPGMIARGRGKILVIGSASALRGMRRTSTYSAARGAQLAYVQAVGVELAPHNVKVNAIAQNFVDNPTYFPESVQQDPRFQERLKREVPLGRLVAAREDAEFAAYLCSDAADCFVGQVFPICGGWAIR
jgi:2-keto-3-deoxy-L-fuconate dehydrogenase